LFLLKTDDSRDSLRERDDFKEILRKLE